MTVSESTLIPRIEFGLDQPATCSEQAIDAGMSAYVGSLLKKIEDVRLRIDKCREGNSSNPPSYHESDRPSQDLNQDIFHNASNRLLLFEQNLAHQKQTLSEFEQALGNEARNLMSNQRHLSSTQQSQRQLHNQIEELYFSEEVALLAHKKVKGDLNSCLSSQARLQQGLQGLQIDLQEEILRLEAYEQELKSGEETKEEIRQELQRDHPLIRLDRLFIQAKQEQEENQKKVALLKKDNVEIQDRISMLKIAQQDIQAQAATIHMDQQRTHEAYIQIECTLENLEPRFNQLELGLAAMAFHLSQLEHKQEEIARNLQQAEREQEEKEQLLDQIDQAREFILWHQGHQAGLIDWEEETPIVSNAHASHLELSQISPAQAIQPSKGVISHAWKWIRKSLLYMHKVCMILFHLFTQALTYVWAQTMLLKELATYQWAIIKAVYSAGSTIYFFLRQNPGSAT